MKYKLEGPFEIYDDGLQISDKNGHLCSAESSEIAEAILAALQLAERISPKVATK